MGTFKLAGGLISLGLLHASCGEIGLDSPAGGRGGVAPPSGLGGAAPANGGAPSESTDPDVGGHGPNAGQGGAAGERLTPSGGAPTGQAGDKQVPTGAGGAGQGIGAAGAAADGEVDNLPECGDVRPGRGCDPWPVQACVSDTEICACLEYGRPGPPTDQYYLWSCAPRGCPPTPPEPKTQECIGETWNYSRFTCEYGDRVCVCEATREQVGFWKCTEG